MCMSNILRTTTLRLIAVRGMVVSYHEYAQEYMAWAFVLLFSALKFITGCMDVKCGWVAIVARIFLCLS